MKRTSVLIFVLAFLAFSVYAKGPADKVTGEYVLNGVHHRLVSAHEAMGKRPQKGFFLSWRDDGSWYEMDFNDTENTCVNVFTEGEARIGGLISGGNIQVGRYVGFDVVDGGEPGYVADGGHTYLFSTVDLSEDARLALLDWCERGVVDDTLTGYNDWGPHVVTDGNVQVHYSPKDPD